MKTRLINLKTGVVICSLIAVPSIAQISSAKPNTGIEVKSKTNDKSKKAEAGSSLAINVKGLACPFCVHGLGKKLKKIKGVLDVEIDLKSGMARVTYAKGVTPDHAALKNTIKKAGFTPGEMKAVSKGKSGNKGKDK